MPQTHGVNWHVDTPLPVEAVSRSLLLVGAVHELGPAEVAAALNPLKRQALVEMAVTLAAMVPDEYSPAELLAWNDSRYEKKPADNQAVLFPAIEVTRQLKPHGTHAAFNRHRAAKEEPCPACWHGEREYQREKGRRLADKRRARRSPSTAEIVIGDDCNASNDELEAC